MISPLEAVFCGRDGLRSFLVLAAELQAGEALVMKIGVADAMDIPSDEEIFYVYHSAVASGGTDPVGELESENVQGLLVIAYIIKIFI